MQLQNIVFKGMLQAISSKMKLQKLLKASPIKIKWVAENKHKHVWLKNNFM